MQSNAPFILTVALLAASPSARAQTPVAVGGEVQVNTYTTDGQDHPRVAVAPDGDFVVVWQSDGSDNGDPSYSSVQGKRYASNGGPLGAQFLVNAYTPYPQGSPSVGVAPDGDFVVVWQSYGSDNGDTSAYGVQGQRYASSGAPLGGQFLVNTYTSYSQISPVVAVGGDGGFVVVWQSEGSDNGDTSLASVQGRRYASSGAPLGGQFLVNTYTTNDQVNPSVAADADGDFVVVWQSYGSDNGDTSQYSIQGQRYASSGAPLGGQFRVNTYTPSYQWYPSVAMDSDGDFVVVWQSDGSDNGDTSSYSIQGQRYDSNGAPLGGQFLVNTYTTSSQAEPSVAVEPAGDFVVVWASSASDASDTSSASVQGQRHSSNGARIGEQFQVNTYTTSVQSSSSVAVAATGDFAVAWRSSGSGGDDADNTSIQAQRFRVTGDVGDRVFMDTDADGIQDVGEVGIPEVGVWLFDGTSTLVASTETDMDGLYSFRAKEGFYYLEFEMPSLFTFSPEDRGGDDTLDSDADPVTGETDLFAVVTTVSDPTLDAGAVPLAVLGDLVWDDADGDGVLDDAETGLAGVTVALLAGGQPFLSTVTDANGRYFFIGLPDGSYQVRVTAPPSYAFSARDQGGDDTRDSDVDPLTGLTDPISYSAGTAERTVDAAATSKIFSDGFESGNTSGWSASIP